MEMLEITYTRVVSYTLNLEAEDIKDLLARIKKVEGLTGKDLPRATFLDLIENGELLDDHSEGVTAYLNGRDDAEIIEQDDPEDIEINY